jgi:hypothetical protein
MGRGNQRVHEGAKDEPYLWYRLRGLPRQGLRCFKIDRIFQQKNPITTCLHMEYLMDCEVQLN